MIGRTDAELVRAARDGDKNAFEQLVDRYLPIIQRIALRVVRRPELAQDMAQESILQAYLSLDKLRDPERFASWLYGITLNVCRSYLRDQKQDFLSLESLAGGMRYDGPLLTDQEPGPQEVAEAHELHETVFKAVETLSAANRVATLLFYYEELSVQEIAAVLGITVSATKSRLFQSRRHLREQFVSVYGGQEFIRSEIEGGLSMVQVSVVDVVVDVKSGTRVVVLANQEKRRALPIWVGPFEGDAIALTLKAVSVYRPLTYDFVANLLTAMDIILEEVRIEALRGNTFYAVAKLRSGDIVRELDARPSDALALALRIGSPIYVSEDVLEKEGRDIPDAGRVGASFENWYYSFVRDTRTEFPDEDLQKVWKSPASLFPSTKPDKPPTEETLSDEEKEKMRQELMEFVFGRGHRSETKPGPDAC